MPRTPRREKRAIRTISRQVKGNSTRASCGTTAMARARSRAGIAASGRPESSTAPSSGTSVPASSFKSVVLPAPLGPRIPVKLPSGRLIEKSSISRRPPYAKRTDWAARASVNSHLPAVPAIQEDEDGTAHQNREDSYRHLGGSEQGARDGVRQDQSDPAQQG